MRLLGTLNSQERYSLMSQRDAKLCPGTALGWQLISLHTEELLCGGMSAHRILHIKSISKWKIPPTYTLIQSVRPTIFFPHQTVHFPFLGHRCTKLWLPKLEAAKLKPFHPVLSIFSPANFTSVKPNLSQRGVQNSTFFQASSVHGELQNEGIQFYKINGSICLLAISAIWTINIYGLHNINPCLKCVCVHWLQIQLKSYSDIY